MESKTTLSAVYLGKREAFPVSTGKISGRLTRFDHNEIVAARHAGISVEQLAREYHRQPETIRTIIRRGFRE